MNVQAKFSAFLKKDAIGQYHIIVRSTTYVVEVKKTFNAQSGRNEYHIVKINYLAVNGDIYPVPPYDIFSDKYLVKTLWREIKKENKAAYERYKAAESSNQYHMQKSQQRRKHGMNSMGRF